MEAEEEFSIVQMWPARERPFAAKEMALATTILTEPGLQPRLSHRYTCGV